MSRIATLLVTALLVQPNLADPLNTYNVDPSLVSVSGLSSGGYMAGQLGVAYSGIFQTGFGVFAAGPFDCARDQYFTNCMYNAVPFIDRPTFNMRSWSGNQIDPVSNLANRQMFLACGTADPTVGLNPMDQLQSQLSEFYDPSKFTFDTIEGAGHTFPTDFDSPGNAPCNVGSQSPFISNCGYDGSGAALKSMYGELKPRNDGELTGTLVNFDQAGDFGAEGMADSGFVYVPTSCEKKGTVCKLHVALHGCRQDPSHIGMAFVENTGYQKWADTNDIIILYPQTKRDIMPSMIWGGSWLPNPNACWDWNGWYGHDADQKSGVQMTAIVNQVQQLIGSCDLG